MSIRLAARRVALAVPPLRRLYEFARQQAAHNDQLSRFLQAEHSRYMDLETTHNALLGEYRALENKHRTAELQLYVLRSDHQRAATRNESLAKLVQEADQRAEAFKVDATRNESLAKLLQNVSELAEQIEMRGTSAAELADRVDAHLSTFYAKLAGRLTMLSSEVADLRGARKDTAGARLYLDLLEAALTGWITKDPAIDPWTKGFDPEVRAIGRDWPRQAHTMIGSARLRNLRVLTEQVLLDNVPGDMIEAGVWRGGACILMRGVLAAYGETERTVWVADSFEGLPAPDAQYPADTDDKHSTFEALSVPIEEVKQNFEVYGLLDGQVKFLKGWFKDTLHSASIERLSILRLDGDMYSSTIQTLNALYEKLSPGGFVIVDDYILKGCRTAVDDFRKSKKIEEPMQEIDGAAVYWRKQ